MGRGKGSERKQRHCGYNRPHQPHVYSGEKNKDQGEAGARKYWCPGREVVADASTAPHRHVWESDRDMPVMRGEDGKPYVLFSPYDENPTWEGPLECRCGKSKWLTKGRYKPKETVRFPHADALERITALKAKLDSGGPEALDEQDKAELEAIAADIIRVLQPLMDQLQKMGEMIVKMIQSFLDSLSQETVAYLAELGKSIGEKPDHVDTIELYEEGTLIATHVLTPTPAPAASATAILSDEDQMLSEPITSPAEISVEVPQVRLQPGHAIVGGRIISLDDLPIARAQRFGRASEY